MLVIIEYFSLDACIGGIVEVIGLIDKSWNVEKS